MLRVSGFGRLVVRWSPLLPRSPLFAVSVEPSWLAVRPLAGGSFLRRRFRFSGFSARLAGCRLLVSRF